MKTKIISSTILFFTFCFSIFMSENAIAKNPSPSSPAASNTITGHLYYAGTTPLGMFSSSLSLISEGVTINTVQTDLNGNYIFTDVADGTYRILPSTSIPWGGVNATDSYLMMLHFIQDSPLTGIEFIASDVYRNGYINSFDALATAKRFVGLDGTFAIGDFYFENPIVTISGGTVQIVDIYGIAYGDSDGSYTFSAGGKQDASISLSGNSVLNFSAGQDISIPIGISNTEGMNAISLSLMYSPQQMEITSVTTDLSGGTFIYNVSRDNIKISWYDVNAIQTSSEVPSFTINAKLSSKLTSNQNINLSIDPSSEIAGDKGVRSSNSSISLPEIKIAQNSQNDGATLRISPNPVCNDCKISYFSLQSQSGSIKVKNLLGAVLFEEGFNLENGSNSKLISMNDLPKGIYIVEIWSENKKLESKKIVKS